ncbi:transposase [Streptomyces phaeofaciens]|uniref:transposase n=1 Tax=Streptomyces phaeofaciens TaxID=68254 RepID=UPI0036D007B7
MQSGRVRGAHGADRRSVHAGRTNKDPDRCQAAGLPDKAAFATKSDLARQMIERPPRILDAGHRAAWITGDEVYGGNPKLRAALEARGSSHVLAIAWPGPSPHRHRQVTGQAA